MRKKVFKYENGEVRVKWDMNRCIHAEECVNGLPDVFDPGRKPWIEPDNASLEDLKEVIVKCPSGALHYELKDSDQEEQPPKQNVITIEENGPVYIHGNIVIRDMDDNVVLKDTRVAMCRCGASGNKPLCDNSHKDIGFEADTSFNSDRLRTEPVQGEGGELSIKLFDNAPFSVQGNYELVGKATGREKCSKKMSFCRCGGSSTKPFCDGTHKKIGFVSE